MRLLPILLLLLSPIAHAQWDIEDQPTTADLRGVSNTGGGAVWASGSHGTVVRSEDGGYLWQACAIPPGAKDLDFRGIQAWDENTAIVMSSGKGDLSRLYKTTDGCHTWKLVFTNPDKDGFWDTIRRVTTKQLYLAGDPVNGKFSMFYSADGGDTWFIADDPGLEAEKGAGAFAASNTSLLAEGPFMLFGTGGTPSPHVYYSYAKCESGQAPENCPMAWAKSDVPLAGSSAAAGIFSLAARTATTQAGKSTTMIVAVGGTYDKPDLTTGTAATSADGGKTWTSAATPPKGYRSAVAYDPMRQTLITVGPNGTDISTDDGTKWHALKPLKGQPADADQHWNALSYPFAVGPKGRIGKLNMNALSK
jgi:photosystem II stability/assembly factor-like uncharacterized protein